MPSKSLKLKIAFWTALFFTLFAPLFFPKAHLLYFSPYLVLSYYKCTRLSSVLRSFFSGLLIDLLSSSYFGMTAVNYSLVSFLTYGQKRNFFEDKHFTLPFMTTIFSLLSTIFSLILLLFFGQKLSLSFRWLLTDFLGMSVIDGLYAYVLFSLPFQLTEKISKMKVFRKSHEEA